MNKIKLITLKSAKELGKKVEKHLKEKSIKLEESRFSNGEGKVTIKGNIKGEDIYLLADIGNYGLTYKLHEYLNHYSPDEHYEDIKRTISALSGASEKVTVIMPLLYESRQHKRKAKESSDCAIALQELIHLGVDKIITFDCHDPNISNAIPNTPFENIYPTDTILKEVKKEKLKDILVISPDLGASTRARYFAEKLQTNVGVFYKRRDLTKVINGKNPIIEHTYLGPSVKDKDIIVVDDMIASGTSMLEVGELLKKQGARKIIFIATFSLFTEGIEKFEENYKNHTFDKLYTTNLSFIENKYQKDWLEIVDCSKDIALAIKNSHNAK